MRTSNSVSKRNWVIIWKMSANPPFKSYCQKQLTYPVDISCIWLVDDLLAKYFLSSRKYEIFLELKNSHFCCRKCIWCGTFLVRNFLYQKSKNAVCLRIFACIWKPSEPFAFFKFFIFCISLIYIHIYLYILIYISMYL